MRARWPGSWPTPAQSSAWRPPSWPTRCRRPAYRMGRAADHRHRHRRLPALLARRPAAARRAIRRPRPGCSIPAAPPAGRRARVLTHRNLLFACHCYYADIDYIGPQRHHPARGAADPRLRALRARPHRARLAQCHPVGLLRSRARARRLCRATPTSPCSPRRPWSPASSITPRPARPTRAASRRSSTAARRCTSPTSKRALALFGPKLYQLYGQGESPMTITGLDKALHADTPSSQTTRSGSVGAGVARTGVAVRVVDEAGRELPPGEIGEIVTAQRLRDAGLLEQSRGQRQGAARRLAVDRRSRLASTPRLPHPQGPLQGHDHLRRRPTSIRARSRRCC